ncbi:MAG: hypothetical protein ACM3YM_08670 [Sphingomonadales bacterium]
MTHFASDQWVMLALVFLLGLLIGMFLAAGTGWKRRYQEEAARADGLQAENSRLRSEAREMESLRHAAAKSEGRIPPPPEQPA